MCNKTISVKGLSHVVLLLLVIYTLHGNLVTSLEKIIRPKCTKFLKTRSRLLK